jgi:hypothetical protein
MNSQSQLAPIVLFVYNRPWHTRQTVEALQQDELAAQNDLFIFCDGSKSVVERESVSQVREYVRGINGFKSVKVFEREKNFGLASSIISGVTEIVNKQGKIIVLEDDMVTSPYFLRYMNYALELYENEEKVISIHGYVYPIKAKLPVTFFLKGADCWGWGTWKRGWDLFEADGSKLLNELQDRKLERRFDFNGTYDYIGMLKGQIEGKNDSWAVRWYASALLNDRLTLYPGQSLVQNIGNDASGTHCGETYDYGIKIASTPIYLEYMKPEEDKKNFILIQKYFKSIQLSFLKRLMNNFKSKIST